MRYSVNIGYYMILYNNLKIEEFITILNTGDGKYHQKDYLENL